MNFYTKKVILILACFFFSHSAAFSFDYSHCSVKLDGYSKKVYSEKVSEYRIRLTDSEFILPDTPFQRVVKMGRRDNVYTLLLRSGKGVVSTPESSGNYLSDTRLLNLKNSEKEKLGKRFKGSKNIINDVERFVFYHIDKKTIGVPIVSASHLLKSRTGDCTEHTVLTVAILRSLSIPARGIVGMLLSREFGGFKNIFVYHMWAEAFVKGKWILVDATRPGEKHPNRYVAFAYHHLKTEMPLPYLKAVSAMKNFTVEYVGE